MLKDIEINASQNSGRILTKHDSEGHILVLDNPSTTTTNLSIKQAGLTPMTGPFWPDLLVMSCGGGGGGS